MDKNHTKFFHRAIVGIVGTTIIIGCGFLIYRWNKRRKEQPTPTLIIPGTTTVRYNHNEHNLPGTADEYNRSSYILAWKQLIKFTVKGLIIH